MPERPPLRLLHINSAPKWTGEAAHSVDLCQGMVERGHAAVWIGSEGSIAVERAREAGLETHTLRLKSSFGWWRELSDIRRLRRTIEDFRPDIVHCHRGKDHFLALLALRGWEEPRPLLLRTRHVVMPVRQHWGNRYIYAKKTDFMLAVSRATASSLGELWPGGREGVERAWRHFVDELLAHPGDPASLAGQSAAIVLSSADLRLFHPGNRDLAWREEAWGIAPDELAVGLVGRIQRIKGQHVFLEAASLLAERFPKVHFLSAGRGSPHRIDGLLEKGRKGPLGRRWHVLGEVKNVERTIACFDVGAVASLGSEGSSRVMYEYLASGLPTVATRVGGIPEMLEAYPGIDVELVEPDDSKALAAALALQIEKVVAGRPQRYPDEVLARLGRERWLDNIESVYRDLVDRRP